MVKQDFDRSHFCLRDIAGRFGGDRYLAGRSRRVARALISSLKRCLVAPAMKLVSIAANHCGRTAENLLQVVSKLLSEICRFFCSEMKSAILSLRLRAFSVRASSSLSSGSSSAAGTRSYAGLRLYFPCGFFSWLISAFRTLRGC